MDFKEEEKLNGEFRMFVDNYRLAYEGGRAEDEGCVFHLMCICVTNYNWVSSCFILDSFQAGVVLPQGPSFEHLTQLFSNIESQSYVDLLKEFFGDGEHVDSADSLRTLLK